MAEPNAGAAPEPEVLIERFYRAFDACDAGAMGACYHPEARFRDEVFELRGAEVAGMWSMLCANAKDLQVEATGIRMEEEEVVATWEARYTFNATGRRVHNRIESRFRFRDGRILDQVDRFPFWRWARQALGLPGFLLGWTPLLRDRVKQRASRQLDAFLERKAS